MALTNKSGDVCLWTVDETGANYMTEITPHTSFVNLVEWSNWKKMDEDTCKAFT